MRHPGDGCTLEEFDCYRLSYIRKTVQGGSQRISYWEQHLTPMNDAVSRVI